MLIQPEAHGPAGAGQGTGAAGQAGSVRLLRVASSTPWVPLPSTAGSLAGKELEAAHSTVAMAKRVLFQVLFTLHRGYQTRRAIKAWSHNARQQRFPLSCAHAGISSAASALLSSRQGVQVMPVAVGNTTLVLESTLDRKSVV